MSRKIVLMLFFYFFMLPFAQGSNFALDFGEVDEFKFVEIGGDSRFDTDEITVEAWIKPTSLPTGHYIYEGRSTIIWNGNQAGGHDPYIFYINEYGALEAHVDFDNGEGVFITDTTPVSLNEWHHVALVISATYIRLYLDGDLTEELIHNNGPAVKGYSHVAIGRHRYYQNPFGGLMDEVRIWDRALTEVEMQNYMYAELTGNENGLVAYWNFNDGDGQAVLDSTSNQIDGVLGLNSQVESYDPSWVIGAQVTVMDFEEPLPGGLIPIHYSSGTTVTIESVITDQFSDLGIVFEGVALVRLGVSPAPSGVNGIGGINSAKLDYSSPMTFRFVSPADDSIPALTDYFAFTTDLWASGNPMTIKAYSIDDNLVGSLFFQEIRGEGGIKVKLQDIGMFHTVVIDEVYNIGGIALDLLEFGDVQPAFIPCTLDIRPDTLNKKSNGNFITCYIELPGEYDVDFIDIETITLTVDEATIYVESFPMKIGDYNDNGIPDLMVKFDRQSGQDACVPGVVEMTLYCELYDGTIFEGEDTVLVIDKGR
jgi:concanavalin A-like lectin/glucanase superfamily protein